MEEEEGVFEGHEIVISSPTTDDAGDITLDCTENITIAQIINLLDLTKIKMQEYLVEVATKLGVEDKERIEIMFKEFTMKDYQDHLNI